MTPCHSLGETTLTHHNATHERRKKDHVCLRCAGELTIGGTTLYCQDCAQKSRDSQNELHHNRKKNGLCACGETASNGRTTCDKCYEKYKERGIRRREKLNNQGLCIGCEKRESLEASQLCERCYLRQAAKRFTDNAENWEILKHKLEQQQHTCPYTGRKLILGKNTSLDHILPKSRRPDLILSVDNLEWVDRTVNMAKRDLTPIEFLDLIQEIVAYKGLT